MTFLSHGPGTSALKAAQKKMPGVVVLQWAGNLALGLLAALWLQIPDSHVWQFALSILLGLSVVLAVLWLYAKTVGDLRSPATSVFLRMAVLILSAALWLLVLHFIGLLRGKEALLAGFWNSKLPPHLRIFFNYTRLLAWQEHLYDLVQWILAGLLLPLAIEASALGLRSTNLKRSARVYGHGMYWLVVVVAGFAGTALTRALAAWTPGRGVGQETVSLLLRLGVAYTADILLWSFVLALISIYLERADH